jgi:menaquinone-dependent protoporphyrinogen oxidase
MRILMIYGTTEGHTRELCNFAASQLRASEFPTTVEEAGRDPSQPDPSPYDVVFVAASLHMGRYQPRLVEYARTHHATLDRIRSAFISVSLSAAGQNPHDWEGLEQCVARFEHETLWTPSAIHHAAGAIRYSQYDFFKRLAVKHIAAERGQRTVISHDYDLTDYETLSRFVMNFVNAPVLQAG